MCISYCRSLQSTLGCAVSCTWSQRWASANMLQQGTTLAGSWAGLGQHLLDPLCCASGDCTCSMLAQDWADVPYVSGARRLVVLSSRRTLWVWRGFFGAVDENTGLSSVEDGRRTLGSLLEGRVLGLSEKHPRSLRHSRLSPGCMPASAALVHRNGKLLRRGPKLNRRCQEQGPGLLPRLSTVGAMCSQVPGASPLDCWTPVPLPTLPLQRHPSLAP